MSFRRSAAALSCAAAAFAVAPHAEAYCRTITAQLPADYTPTACYLPDGAIPLFWKNACVGYSLQQDASVQVSLADAKTAMAEAFAKWSDASCPSGGKPSIQAQAEPDVACSEVGYSYQGPNQNVIVFRDTSWPHSDPNNTLALTTVTFDTKTGELYDADMEINTADSKVVVSGPVPANAFDFQSIVTHEAGHFLGLAHTPLSSAIMFAHYNPGSVDLKADDVDGICAIYDPSGARSTAGGSVSAVSCDPTPRHGFGTQCGPMGPAPETTTTSSSKCSVSGAPGGAGGGAGWMLGAALGLAAVVRRRGAKLRRMKSGLRSAALTALFALGAGTFTSVAAEREAKASVSIAVMLDELVRDSTAAAMVTPVEQKSVWEDGRIYTYTRVHVDRAVAGSAGDEMWVRTMGGSVGRVGQLVDGEAVLTVGRQALLFVKPATEVAGIFVVTGRAQGQFPVVLDETTHAPLLIHSAAAGSLMAPQPSRVALLVKERARAGVTSEPKLAADVLHKRPVDDAAQEIAAAWGRIHAAR